MKKVLLTLMVVIVFWGSAFGQLWKMRRYEASAGLSTTQFFGDIGGFSRKENILGIRDFSFRHTRFNVNTSLRYRIISDVAVRLNLAFGLFHSTDVRGSNIERGFESRTTFFEPALIGEYYLVKNRIENSYLLQKGKQNPLSSIISMLDFYVFTGFGGISFKATPNDKLAAVSPATKGFAPVIPAGIGANMIFSDRLNFGAELSGRYAFTDLLDGYSSQYSKSNDIYYFLTFTATWKLRTGENGLPVFR
jgi:hypothetical protein